MGTERSACSRLHCAQVKLREALCQYVRDCRVRDSAHKRPARFELHIGPRIGLGWPPVSGIPKPVVWFAPWIPVVFVMSVVSVISVTILFKIITRMKLLFSNYLGDYSYRFQGSSELISITVTFSLFFLQTAITGNNSPQAFPRFFGDYSYMI